VAPAPPVGRFTTCDLRSRALTIEDFTEVCDWRGTAPESMFAHTLLVVRSAVDEVVILRSRTLTRTGPAVAGGKQQRELADADEFTPATDRPRHPHTLERALHQHDLWLADHSVGNSTCYVAGHR
jgi:arylamine N-acetyltransferase